MAFLLMSSSGAPIDWSQPAPEFSDFHQRIWAGKISLADSPVKVAFGRIHWERLLQNMRQARFDDALSVVAERHACA
jgi:hypothetical protein